MDDPDSLRREILRLEAILDDHGIDHEPEQFGPPPPPPLGPPTLMEHLIAVTTDRYADRMARSILTGKNGRKSSMSDTPRSLLEIMTVALRSGGVTFTRHAVPAPAALKRMIPKLPPARLAALFGCGGQTRDQWDFAGKPHTPWAMTDPLWALRYKCEYWVDAPPDIYLG